MIRGLREVDWRTFGLLLASGLLGVVAILPFMSDLVRTFPVAQTGPSLPMPLILALALVQNGLLLSVAIPASRPDHRGRSEAYSSSA